MPDHRIERRIRMIGRVLQYKGRRRGALAPNPLYELSCYARFSDASLPRQGNDLTLMPRRASPALEQDGDFFLSGDELGKSGAARLQPRYFALSNYPIDRNRCSEALEVMLPQVAILEHFCREPPGDFRYDDRVGLGHGLQTGRKIYRFADDSVSIRDALRDIVAH